MVGEGITAISKGKFATQKDIDTARKLFDSVGKTVVVDEKHMDAITGLSASGPAFIYIILESLAEGGVEGGAARVDLATLLASQMALGAAKMVLETGDHPAQLKDTVTTPAGCTYRRHPRTGRGWPTCHAHQGRCKGGAARQGTASHRRKHVEANLPVRCARSRAPRYRPQGSRAARTCSDFSLPIRCRESRSGMETSVLPPGFWMETGSVISWSLPSRRTCKKLPPPALRKRKKPFAVSKSFSEISVSVARRKYDVPEISGSE